MAIQRKSLGRGLSSIISAGAKKAADSGVQKVKSGFAAPLKSQISSHGIFSEIPVDKVVPSPYQARKEFSEAEIKNLADSIASEGLLQPILVRQTSDGLYELLAGERRLRAHRMLGLKKIVACVQTASDSSSAAKGLIENMQRADLNPIEEAHGIAYLMANFHLTQDAVSQRLGKPRSSIANSVRLLKLPQSVQGYISSGLLSFGHAKLLLAIDDAAQQEIVARRIIEGGLNIRNTEDLLQRMKDGESRKKPDSPANRAAQTAVIRDIQNKISLRLNAAVEVKHSARRGKIIIEYLGNEDLERILDIIGVKI